MKKIKRIFNLYTILFLFLFTGCEEYKELIADKTYRFNASIQVDGRIRTYLLVLPPNYYENSSGFSLVIGMHGTGGSAAQFERDYKFTQAASDSKFIVAYPEGVQGSGVLKIRSWNAGTCCEYALEHNINDVKFISELIDTLIGSYKINPKKVYATGISNGGMLAYRLACEIPHKIAAIAAVSTTMVVTHPCNPSRAVPILHMHSALDTKVPANGGRGLKGYYFPPVDSVLNVWSNKNSCSSDPEVLVDNSQYKFTKWPLCEDETTIEYYLTKDGGHSWPGGIKSREFADTPSTAIDANTLMWEFFQRFELP